MTPRPDDAQVEAARALEIRKRLREVEQEILTRWPEGVLEPSLSRIAEVMDLLGQPQRSFPSVHLTGTNGKTSTTRMVERLLREHSLRTGRFTSPHLHTMRERIAVDGAPISPERFIEVYDDVLPYIRMADERSAAAGGPPLSYFEVCVTMAYAAFADAPVDVGVVEVGLGGVWDATNVIDAAVSVVTPIAVDHQRLLGDTVEAIAHEKAGVIKPGGIAVVATQPEEALDILRERCEQVGARLAYQGEDFAVEAREAAVGGQVVSVRGLAGSYPDLYVPLFGAHQAQNVATAIAAVEAFVGGGEQALAEDVVRAAAEDLSSPGRLEVVRRDPLVLVDGAHNPAGMAALAAGVKDAFPFTRVIGCVAILADKDADGMLPLLAEVLDQVVCTRTTSHRAMDPAELGELAAEYFGEERVTVVPELPAALDLATQLADDAGPASCVLATGSITMAAEARMLLGRTDT